MAPSFRRFVCRSAIGTVAAALASAPMAAQTGETHRHAAADPTRAVHDAMSGMMNANPHMRMSPARVARAADSARAARIVTDARDALAKYRDVLVAEREGYQMFAPNVKNQRVYHFTKLGAAVRERFSFDAARPTSLLYRKNGDGTLRLVGAMYTAPKDASLEDLDARVPLGIARWHLHTNMCVPRLAQQNRWREMNDGKLVFGPASPLATEEACDAVNGRFLPVVFNWMVHVNVFDSDVWGDHH